MHCAAPSLNENAGLQKQFPVAKYLEKEKKKDPENNDDPDERWSFWKDLQPMLKQLNSLDASKFKHEVHGLLISYTERSQSNVPIFHSVHQASFSAIMATRLVINQALAKVHALPIAVL
ncbi:hypothetical protein PoB_003347900 [Plakobranchus ocellatus]|uniref:Uncharacterized protein n=1 Tax=Plakobranchus ocellatus TaxID=259542 RepID=A0AAV4AL69_9GAST|nr:hypothetical protein PoB_003347900 [Plakobranchus ocellatus]